MFKLQLCGNHKNWLLLKWHIWPKKYKIHSKYVHIDIRCVFIPDTCQYLICTVISDIGYVSEVDTYFDSNKKTSVLDKCIFQSSWFCTKSTGSFCRYQMRNLRALNLTMKDLTNVPDAVFEEAQKAEVTIVDLCKNKFSEVPKG